MIYTLDDKDAQILVDRIAEWNRVLVGPRVGDFVQLPDGTVRRFTHDWGDTMQTTCGPDHPCFGDASFYFAGDYMSFSGSLDRAIGKVGLVDTGEIRNGAAWFFHHGEVRAHNAVRVQIPCRVYRYNDIAATQFDQLALEAGR